MFCVSGNFIWKINFNFPALLTICLLIVSAEWFGMVSHPKLLCCCRWSSLFHKQPRFIPVLSFAYNIIAYYRYLLLRSLSFPVCLTSAGAQFSPDITCHFLFSFAIGWQKPCARYCIICVSQSNAGLSFTLIIVS